MTRCTTEPDLLVGRTFVQAAICPPAVAGVIAAEHGRCGVAATASLRRRPGSFDRSHPKRAMPASASPCPDRPSSDAGHAPR